MSERGNAELPEPRASDRAQLWQMVELLERRGAHDDALRCNREILTLDPHDRRALLSCGRLLILTRDFVGAQQYFQTALDRYPNHGAARKWGAISCLLVNMRHEAKALFETQLNSVPNDVDARMGLAILAIKAGDGELAAGHLKEAIKVRFGQHPKTSTLLKMAGAVKNLEDRFRIFRFQRKGLVKNFFGLAFVPETIKPREAGSYERAFSAASEFLEYAGSVRALCEADREKNGATHWYYTNLGHHYYRAERFDDADSAYSHAREICRSRRLVPIDSARGVLSWMGMGELRTLADSDTDNGKLESAQYQWIGDADRDASASFLVGCDEGYLRFLPRYLASLVTISGAISTGAPDGKALKSFNVFCIINRPSSESLAWLDEARAELESRRIGVRLLYTIDNYKPHDNAYYTCLRFLAGGSAMMLTASPFFITDIDIALNSGLSATLGGLSEADVALRFLGARSGGIHPTVGRPWNVNAQMSYISNTEKGRKFVELVRRYILKMYDPENPSNWIIDQAALRRVADYCAGYDTALRITNLAAVGMPFETALHELAKDDFISGPNAVTMLTFSDFLTRGSVPAKDNI